MIRRCFSVLDGIGPTRAKAIRAAGIADWQGLATAESIPGISEKLHESLVLQVGQWSQALARDDAAFFAEHLPRPEHWTLFEPFGDAVRYLDIETTGLSAGYHDVTVVGIHDGTNHRALVRGRDLSAAAIQQALAGCKLLVTYYGSAFDVPFLSAAFPEIRWDLPHFDLCFAGRRVGLTGGLKEVERKLGMRRDASITEVDGFEAVRLWRRHERGDPAALPTLLRYNEADTHNLVEIARIVYERLCQKALA